MSQSSPDPDDLPLDWQLIGSYRSFRRADERALVLLATGFDSWLHPSEDRYHLLVPPEQFAAARAEILAYEAESADNRKSPIPVETPAHSGEWIIHLITLALVFAFAWQSSDPTITELGLLSTRELLENGEWWRPITALFLHSDIGHLLGNLLGMTLFGTLLIRAMGPAWALTGILCSGALGNLLNIAFYYPEPHRSLGASTAVFGALGMLAAHGSIHLIRQRRKLPWRRIAIPLLAGLVLLGWMGGGSPGSNTDVGAHITGFLCGTLLTTMVLVLAGMLGKSNPCLHQKGNPPTFSQRQ